MTGVRPAARPQSLLAIPRWMHPVIQATIRQDGGGADTGVVSATTTTPPVVVWAPGAPPAGFANRLSGGAGVTHLYRLGDRGERELRELRRPGHGFGRVRSEDADAVAAGRDVAGSQVLHRLPLG